MGKGSKSSSQSTHSRSQSSSNGTILESNASSTSGSLAAGVARRERGSAEEISEFIDWETELGVSSDSIDDDIKGTDEVKVFSRLHKTEEEIEQLSIDPDLDEIKRACLILRSGQNIQLPAILASMPRLLRERRKDTLAQILPLLLESLHTRPVDFQMMTAGSMYDIIEKGLLPENVVDAVYICAVKLLNSKDEDISAVWGDVLIISIKFMSQKAIYESILPGCLAYSGLSQPVPLRIWSCRMLGAVTSRLKSNEIEALFQRAMTLCQDTDYEVRACMCHQLNEFAKHVKLDSIRRSLFHEYLELVMDEEDYVRESALANIVKLSEFVDDSTKSNIIVPIWKKLCAEKPAKLMELMSRDFGMFFYHSKSVLADDSVRFFIEFYQTTATSPEEDLRIWSAYNFPGVLKTVGPDLYEPLKLDQLLSHLSMDQSIDVKRRITCGFHEIVEILDRQSQYLLRNVFIRMLTDSEVDVYEPLFKNLNLILKGFALDESARRTAQFDELLFSVLRKEREYASNASNKLVWRIHHDLLKQFKFFIDYFDSEYIHDQCVPLLLKLLSDNVTIPIKKTIIETLCIYLRKMRRLENRIKMTRSIADLREHPSYHTRLLFLWTVRELYNHFSHHFLRETFFDEFLDMARDPVANLRISFVQLAPLFRKSLLRGFHNAQAAPSYVGGGVGLPNAVNKNGAAASQQQQYQAAVVSNLTRLNECLMALCGDPDRDVATLAQDELERVGLGTRRTVKALAAAGLDDFDVGGRDRGGYGITDEEADEDKDREEYEERLLAVEIEEDSVSLRRKDDEFVGGGRTTAGKRMSISKHSVTRGGVSAGGLQASMASAGHRKSAANTGLSKVGLAGMGAAKSMGGPSAALSLLQAGSIGTGQRVLGQANRLTSNANHGSLDRLSNFVANASTSVSANPPDNLKRGKSAGPTGKAKSSTTGPNPPTAGVVNELSQSGKKKSLSSLVGAAPANKAAAVTRVNQVGGKKDAISSAIVTIKKQNEQQQPSASALGRSASMGTNTSPSTLVTKSFAASASATSSQRGITTVKQLPPIPTAIMPEGIRKH
ncbi:armadillo-type protein [Chytriomyces sp. MP71]|nr:armadillo-type protein [Chytriomyces sp. MP71]